MLEVKLAYRDVKHHIERGAYEDNDPRLHGLTDTLLANGHAVYVHVATTPVTVVTSDEVTTEEVAIEEAPSPTPHPRRKRK